MSINKTGVTILLLGKVPLPGLHIEAHIYSYAPQQRLVSHPALGGNGKRKEKKAAQDSCLHGILVMVAEYSFSFFPLISEELTLTIYGESN